MEIFKRFRPIFERIQLQDEAKPEWTTGQFNELEEPLLREHNPVQDKEFLLIAMDQSKVHLEIAEAWAMECPESENLKAALALASLSLQEAYKNVPNIV